MEKYLAVFEEEGEEAFEKYDTPEKLFNRVHYGIQPGDPLPPEAQENDHSGDVEFEEWKDEIIQELADGLEEEDDSESWKGDTEEVANEPVAEDATDDPFSDGEEFEGEPLDNEGYAQIAQQARRFADRVNDWEERPEIESVLCMAAGKIGANLAGGHGLGYDDDAICGNIVKCVWALSDCRFCGEILEQLVRRQGKPEYAELLHESHILAAAIQERINRLRARVWW